MNRVYYEVWHKPSANLVGDFTTKREAIQWAEDDCDVFRVRNDPKDPMGAPLEFTHIHGPNLPKDVK